MARLRGLISAIIVVSLSLVVVPAENVSASSYTLIVSKSGTGSGTVRSSPNGISCGKSCSRSFSDTTTVTLTATAASGSVFTGWLGACTGTGKCSVPMTSAKSVTATFERLYALSVISAGTGTGIVTSSPTGISCGRTCSRTFASETSVTLTATPSLTSLFVGWSGACTGMGTCVVSMTANQTVTATFEPRYTLSVTRSGTGMGSVTSSPTGINCGATCTSSFASGTMVTLSAAPSYGVEFSGWSGACSGVGPCVISMTANRSVTANFQLNAYSLFVTIEGSVSGTVTSSNGEIDCGSVCSATMPSDTTVTLLANPTSEGVFVEWSGACTGTLLSCEVPMNNDQSVTAVFGETYPLTVTKTGAGTGKVISASSGIDCGTICTANLSGTVTLSAVADPGSVFTDWPYPSPCLEDDGGLLCTVNVDSATAVRANFEPTVRVVLVKNGSGTGTVTSEPFVFSQTDPSQFDCGEICEADVLQDLPIELIAAPQPESSFVGWSTLSGHPIDCPYQQVEDSYLKCTMRFSMNSTVVATFERIHSVNVLKSGSGSGTVISDYILFPSIDRIQCGDSCQINAAQGSNVRLVAIADPGSKFVAWTESEISNGTVCATGNGLQQDECDLYVDGARTVTAQFEPAYSLEIRTQGTGTGSIISDPPGIDCGQICSAEFVSGAEITLTAIAEPGSTFVSWSVYDSEICTNNTCTFELSNSEMLFPIFEVARTLIVVKAGAGSGTITSDPPGIFCGDACESDFAFNTEVTLTAVEDPESVFIAWLVDDEEICFTKTCSIELSNSEVVVPVFEPAEVLSIRKSGSGTGSVVSERAGIDCGEVCESRFFGAVTLTAIPDPGNLFVGWHPETDFCNSDTCDFALTTSTVITAIFEPAITLNVQLLGNGSGSVISEPAGIDCGDVCESRFSGTVTLRAIPDAGNTFVGWSEECGTSELDCELQLTEAVSVSATFAPLRNLTIKKTGSGNITSEPEGMKCATDESNCSAKFAAGTSIVLTPSPSPGYVFVGWDPITTSNGRGICAYENDTCVISLVEDVTIVAVFEIPTLAVTKSGLGFVSSSPEGLNCGETCRGTFSSGTTITLTVTPEPGYGFAGWSGACSGTAITCSVLMNSSKRVTASFLPLVSLRVAVNGGTVTSSPSGIHCSGWCLAWFLLGTEVTLTPLPQFGKVSWRGACTGSGSCTVTMTANLLVEASFIG